MKCGNCKGRVSAHEAMYQIDFFDDGLNQEFNDDVFCTSRCLENLLILKRIEKSENKKNIDLEDESFKESMTFDFGTGDELIIGIHELNNYLWVNTQNHRYFIDLKGNILMSK